MTRVKLLVPCALAFALSTCSSTATRALPPCEPDRPLTVSTAGATVVAVGDVADCAGGRQMDVAASIARIAPNAVFALGDLAYPNGSMDDYLDCYAPSFGRFRDITRPVVGNHEYHTPHAGAYYAYFCGAAGASFDGWYSFDLGAWHVVALNSVCGQDLDVASDVATDFGGCGEGSRQMTWLRADLEAHQGRCTIAMWHHPRWSSSSEGSSPVVDSLWRLLVHYGVDIALHGHAHDYQRFPPLDENGARDDLRGVRAFVVGTGGSPLSAFDTDARIRSEVRDNTSHGVLRLDLHEHDYAWAFVPMEGDGFHDEGQARCHH